MSHYQELKIGDTLLQSGIDRSEDYDIIFPESPIGKTIVDIGCHYGYYSLRAAHEGASEVLGVDLNSTVINTANKTKQLLKLDNIVFLRSNALTFNYARQFDIVLCLNFLHHLGTLQNASSAFKLLDSLAINQIILTVTLPQDSTVAYAEEINHNNLTKLRLTSLYFKTLWPGYSVTPNPSPSYPNREIIKIYK